MASHWEELENGKGFKLTISPDEGGAASVFYGKTRDEVHQKVIDSQAHAIRRIEQLRAAAPPTDNSHASPPQPRTLSPDERMQTVSDLTNPATVDRGVIRVVESQIGPMSQFNADRMERAAIEAAEIFAAETPEWYPSDHNKETLVNFVRTQHLDPTSVATYQQAFHRLTAVKLLQPKPVEAPSETEPSGEQQERNAPTLQPRVAPARYSTGIRSQDVSGAAPTPSKRLKWTRAEIDNMSPATYRSHMADPEFQRAVEFYSKPSRRMQATA